MGEGWGDMLRLVTKPWGNQRQYRKLRDKPQFIFGVFKIMGISDTQVLVALAIALIPGVLAFRLSTELYK